MTDLTPPHTIQPPWPLAALLVLAASLFMALTTEMLPAGLLTAMAIDLDVSETAAGWLVSAFAFMMALGAIPLAAATRRIPRRRLLLSVLIGFALVNTATALSGTFTATMIARLTGGLVAGVFWSITVAFATSLVPSNMAGRAVAVVFAGQSVAFCRRCAIRDRARRHTRLANFVRCTSCNRDRPDGRCSAMAPENR